jgi:DNA-binding XRE family transcriptional regulator
MDYGAHPRVNIDRIRLKIDRIIVFDPATCGTGRRSWPKNVRKLPQQRKLTQEQLAFASKIDLTYLSGIERGRRNPSLMVMVEIAEAAGVSQPRLPTD